MPDGAELELLTMAACVPQGWTPNPVSRASANHAACAHSLRPPFPPTTGKAGPKMEYANLAGPPPLSATRLRSPHEGNLARTSGSSLAEVYSARKVVDSGIRKRFS